MPIYTQGAEPMQGDTVTQASLSWLDAGLIIGYLLLLVFLSWRSARSRPADGVSGEEHFLLSGRRLTLPAFVATLVSTWYGGILGVGEFSYLYGISQWVVMGLPYYVFAILFAVFFAGKIRENPAISIPESVGSVYGPRASKLSAALIFVLVNPAPYLLMTAVLASFMLGIDGWYVVVGVGVFSALYVSWGGFGAVVRTDMLQVVLMYGGFIVLLIFAWQYAGNPAGIWTQLPDTHRQPTGGQPVSYLLVWFFIALWTFVDPGFHQRSAAARSPKTARNGILLSILCWFVFDMLTLLTALYGVVILAGMSDAVLIYPALAAHLLPAGLLGLFMLTLLATVMSTLDSFLFLAGQTLGRDMVVRPKGASAVHYTRAGIAAATILALVLVWLFPSVIDLWYVIGSVIIPGLLLPVAGVYYAGFRVPARRAMLLLGVPVLVSLGWLIGGMIVGGDAAGYALFGLEPFYPGLVVSLLLFGYFKVFGRTG